MDDNKPPAPKPKPKVSQVEETLRAPMESRCLERLKTEHANALEGEPTFHCGVPIVRVKAERIADVCRFLKEDAETGAKSYKYIKAGTNHFSFAFTYDCIAASRDEYIDPNLYGWFGPDDF